MSQAPTRVLIVDDDESFGGMVAEVLRERGYDAVRCATPREGLDRAAAGGFDVAVLDLVLPQMSGLDLAAGIREVSPDTQVLILTGQGDMESAIAGIKTGIADYLQKATIQLPKLERAVEGAAERARLIRDNRTLLAQLQESNRLLTALIEVGAELASEPHLDRLLTRLVASAKDLCRAEAGRALLLERTPGDELVIESGIGDGAPTIVGARLQPGVGITTLAIENDRPVLAIQPRQHPRYSHRCDEMPTERAGLLCAPMRHGKVLGVLAVAGSEKGFAPEYVQLLGSLAHQAAVAIDNALQHERAVNFFTHTSEILVSILESVDIYYPGHSRGVAALSDMLTRRLGLSEAERRSIHFAALLHDIGKIRLDPALLRAGAGYGSDEGRRMMQQHPTLGFDLLKPIAMWEEVLPIVHAHHERWDGKGYPRGLAGEEIPLGARVVAVADAFDAMTRDTPHGPRREPEQALAEIEAFAGTQFDPRIVRLFVAEYRQHGDQLRR